MKSGNSNTMADLRLFNILNNKQQLNKNFGYLGSEQANWCPNTSKNLHWHLNVQVFGLYANEINYCRDSFALQCDKNVLVKNKDLLPSFMELQSQYPGFYSTASNGNYDHCYYTRPKVYQDRLKPKDCKTRAQVLFTKTNPKSIPNSPYCSEEFYERSFPIKCQGSFENFQTISSETNFNVPTNSSESSHWKVGHDPSAENVNEPDDLFKQLCILNPSESFYETKLGQSPPNSKLNKTVLNGTNANIRVATVSEISIETQCENKRSIDCSLSQLTLTDLFDSCQDLNANRDFTNQDGKPLNLFSPRIDTCISNEVNILFLTKLFRQIHELPRASA